MPRKKYNVKHIRFFKGRKNRFFFSIRFRIVACRVFKRDKFLINTKQIYHHWIVNLMLILKMGKSFKFKARNAEKKNITWKALDLSGAEKIDFLSRIVSELSPADS